jgi:hypothetical protein
MAASSVREQILAYLVTLIANAGGFTSFVRSREAPIARSEGVVGTLKPEEEENEYKANRQQLLQFVVVVTVVVRGDVPDSVADPYLVATHKAVMADLTLGGLAALVIYESTKWEFEEADRTAASVEVRYRIRYSTAVGDLTQPA